MALLKTENLTKRFGGLVAVDSVDLEVEQGEILGVIGPNGAGKTTLFSLVGGFLKPTQGSVWFDGREITGMEPHNICKAGLGRTFQVVQPFPQITVLENVLVGAYNSTSSTAKAMEIAEEVLDFMEMSHKAGELARGLTIADRKRLEVARALATQPKLLLLDEVMAGLRPKETEEQIEIVRRLQKRGITLIIIEHVMRVIMSLSDRVVVLDHGAKIAEGTPEDVVKMPVVIEAYLGGGAQDAQTV